MRKRVFSIMLFAAAAGSVTAMADNAPLWLRDAAISPDGSRIAFTFKGDIYTVPTTGGKASRLTALPSLEWAPVWSPDGTKIAFATDRNGGSDIYIMGADGGHATRLTFDSASETPEAFTPDGAEIVFSAAIQDAPSSVMFPTARLTEVYTVPAAGGRTRQLLSTPAEKISYLPDGKSFLYHDVKGMENKFRKHHTSSVTRDIWLYDAKNGRHTNLTNRYGEDRNPVVADGGKTLYFLSERNGGSFNVYRMSLDNPADVKAVTDFKEHPVRFLSMADNGTLAFGYDGELYTMKAGGRPQKVAVEIDIDEASPVTDMRFSSGATEAAPSPDGKQMAIVWRGDVFVTSVEHDSFKQITSTPQTEKNVSWSPDGKTLYYTSERDGRRSIYKAEKTRSDEPNFSNATLITETPLFTEFTVDREHPVVSPDGKKMLFVEDRNKIMLMDLASKSVKQITDGSNFPDRDGGFSLEWAPDSRWFATEASLNRHDPYYDVVIINTDDLETINLTNSGYFDMNPQFVLDGNAVMYITDRFGMRNHASWGSQNDVILHFLNKEAYDKYRLSEEDFELLKEVEKAQKKKASADSDKKSKKKKGKKDDAKEEPKEDKNVKIDRKGLEDRIVRLTPVSGALSGTALVDDGESLYYVAGSEDGCNLWKVSLRDDDIELVKKFPGEGGMGMSTLPDGSAVFLIGSKLRKLEPAGSKVSPVTYSGRAKVDRAAEREAMFNFVVNEERERFYNKNMHGVDWTKLTDHYRRFLPYISNNADFADMLSELLGELNVSHTGSGAARRGAADPTASLGLLYDMTYDGPGLRVAEILEKGPFDRSTTAMKPGSIITAINGVAFEADKPTAPLLANVAGKKTLVAFTTPDGKTETEVILPISQGRQSSMMYDRWVKSRAAYVDSISGGRLGYIHLQSMSDDSFRKAYKDLLGRYNTREGVVIDTRWNGGGRLHEDIEVLFSGDKYFTQVVRGVETCDMPSRRWNKPSIMVQCEANYSNAHGTPWVYKHRGLGKLVGAAVPGTMTSVNWVDLQDPELYFGIPVVGYRLPDGSYLENKQLEPDIKVLNDPATVVKGADDQLRVAVETLLRDIDSKK